MQNPRVHNLFGMIDSSNNIRDCLNTVPNNNTHSKNAQYYAIFNNCILDK